MSPKRYLQLKAKQSGSALVVAIFILVVALGFGLTMANIMVSSSQTVAYEVLGTRAYLAANAGAQYGLSQVFPVNQATIACPGPTIPSPNLPNSPGFTNCEISPIECANFLHAPTNTRYYRITATAQCDLGEQIVSRKVEVSARSQ